MVPLWRVILCCLGWHRTKPIEDCKRQCVYCGAWDFEDEWIEMP